MRMLSRSRSVLVLAASLSLLLMTVVAAKSPSYSVAGTGGHCVAHLEYVTPGGPEASVTKEKCFTSFAEAVRFATGRTDIPDGVKPTDLTEEMIRPPADRGVEATYLLGIDFDASGYSGESKLWQASASCVGHNWQVYTLVGTGWNDRISSAQGWSECDIFKHWENPGYDGAVRTCSPDCSYIGDAMNDRTSSLQWRD